jgi:hypothetical protein
MLTPNTTHTAPNHFTELPILKTKCHYAYIHVYKHCTTRHLNTQALLAPKLGKDLRHRPHEVSEQLQYPIAQSTVKNFPKRTGKQAVCPRAHLDEMECILRHKG